ncbi:MAG: hypothetical protein SF123_24750 [Chloroflexota bacterium]|nr:hypothetical protein [Chloroflexota bacterium]
MATRADAHIYPDRHMPPQEPPKDEREPTPDERNAMRAYLQRTEVRLSTLHRIAIAFVSGAGLMILFPLVLKDEITALLRVFIAFTLDQIPLFASSEQIIALVMLLALTFPVALSVVLPLYALYLLLKDIIHFYFTIYTPGFPATLHTPSFVLSGITFSPDESAEMKKRIYAYQYNPNAINFMIPFSAEKREMYFDETIDNTNGEIIPRSRHWQHLQQTGALPDDADWRMVEHFNTAFGLARTLDRKLVEEVATTEASMVRHVLYLRRLVIRYVSALLMFIWTTFVAFIMIPFLQEERLPTFLIMGIGYTIWAIFGLPIMHLPMHWIYRHRKGQVDNRHIDRQMSVLERQMTKFGYVAIALSVIGLALSVIIYS